MAFPKSGFLNAHNAIVTQIEKGEAVLEMEVTNYWMYMAAKPVPAGVMVAIRLEAFDYPEMKTYFEKEAKKKKKSAYHMALSNLFRIRGEMGD